MSVSYLTGSRVIIVDEEVPGVKFRKGMKLILEEQDELVMPIGVVYRIIDPECGLSKNELESLIEKGVLQTKTKK